MINVELSTFLQDVVGGPSCINFPTENRDQVTTASDLTDGDD